MQTLKKRYSKRTLETAPTVRNEPDLAFQTYGVTPVTRLKAQRIPAPSWKASISLPSIIWATLSKWIALLDAATAAKKELVSAELHDVHFFAELGRV